MSKPCPACEEAERKLWHGVYMLGCQGCAARAAARCLAAFNALDPKGTGEKEPLRELVQRVLPNMPFAQARAAVWDWWLRDHRRDGEEKRPGP